MNQSSPQNITVIAARWVVPIRPENTVLENHCVVIEDSTIVDIIPIEHVSVSYPNATLIKRPHHVLMPGLVNAHTHAAMSLLRGIADDLPLMEWLNNHVWPIEAEHVGEDFIRDGVELAIGEMLLSGTTCFNDMYFFPNIVAETAQKHGIRAVVGLIVIDFPSAWAKDTNEYFSKGNDAQDQCKQYPLVTTAMAPHAPYTVNDDNLTRSRVLADELVIPVHMHVHETEHEVQEAENMLGMRPIERLKNLGLLNARLLAVHMTQLNDDEIKVIAESGVNVIHCPESNLKLNSGYCPVYQLVEAGVNVALGTDGAASNNDLDMFGEMQTAALIAKTIANNATALPAKTVLEMSTINGAKALSLEEKIGSIEVGKQADLIAVDLDFLSTQPVYDPIAQLVYAASRQQVSDVWVAGKHQVSNHELQNMNHTKLIHTAQQWAAKIKKN